MVELVVPTKAAHYRRMARDARDLAYRTDDMEIEATSTALASRWEQLAARAERGEVEMDDGQGYRGD